MQAFSVAKKARIMFLIYKLVQCFQDVDDVLFDDLLLGEDDIKLI
jgi:hypothetical protein